MSASGGDVARAAEHVVMVVVNDVVNDSRVLREAAWLARAGLRVTVLGVASGAARDIVAVDHVLVARLPLSGQVSAARSRELARRRAWRPLRSALGDVETRRVAAEVDELMRQHRELADAAAGRGTRLLRRAARVGRRQARRLGEGVDGVLVGGWDSYDRWRSTQGRLVRWPSVVGGLVADYEATFGPALDELGPDVVHAHDVHVLGVAVHAARRAARRGRTMRVVYDAHEFVPGMAVAGRRTARTNAAWRGFEEEYLRHADAVVTVGDGIARLVQETNGLAERPAVVLNVPVPTPVDPGAASRGDVRTDCGLGPEVPLMVYSGTLSAVRGVDTAVRALAGLPEAHLAVVCVPRAAGPVVEGLREQARALGCEERLHLLAPVGPGEVVDYLSTADVGLITMHGGWPNHENAMPNKFFEYLRAGVPLVVTDLECLGGEVRSGGLGATFPSADPSGLAAAVRSVLADLPAVRARVAASPWRVEGDWRVQEVRLREVYERLLGRDLVGATEGRDADAYAEPLDAVVTPQGRPLDPRPLSLDERPAARRRPAPPLLLLGPADLHGSARALAAAVREQVPGLRVEVSAINPPDPQGVDRVVRRTTYHRSLGWQLAELRYVLRETSFVLVEDGGPLAGSSTGGTALRELTYLTGVGVRCALLLHAPPHDVLRGQLDALAGTGVALLVSDPGLLGAVPAARWLPLVLPDEVRRAQESAGPPRPARGDGPEVPVVVAADPVARALVRPGVEAGRLVLHDGPVDDLGVPTEPGAADVVVLGSAGPGSRAAVRAMASGLAVVAGTAGPGPWLPLVEADGSAGGDRLADRADLAARGAAGPAWVAAQHAGPASVAVLREALGLPAEGGAGHGDALAARSRG